jgi:hypothetical protein
MLARENVRIHVLDDWLRYHTVPYAYGQSMVFLRRRGRSHGAQPLVLVVA